MSPAANGSKEVQCLLKALGAAEASIETIALICHPPPVLIESVARRFRDKAVLVVVENAKDLERAKKSLAGLDVRLGVGTNLGAVTEGEVDLVVLRASGTEGKKHLAAWMYEARIALRRGGELYLLTRTKRGSKSHLQMLKCVFGHAEVVSRGSGGIRVLRSRKSRVAPESRPDEAAYRFDVRVLGQTFSFETDAHVFSKDRLDSGTRLLLEHVEVGRARNILDLGCGYGPLGIVLARCHPEVLVTMVDVDLRAVSLAEINARLNEVASRTSAILSYGLRGLEGARFDLAVTHFPLHVPRRDLKQLVSEVWESLGRGCDLWGVALKAYDVRRTVEEVFGECDTVIEGAAEEGGPEYRVVRARKPARRSARAGRPPVDEDP